MTAIGALLEHPYAQALSWALLHFIWQGAAIGLIAWLIWRYAGWSARARYTTGVVAMALMLAAPIATLAMIGPQSPASAPTTLLEKTMAPDAAGSKISAASLEPQAPSRPSAPAEPFEPFVLALWLAGVMVLSARLLGGWFVARRFTTTGIAPVTTEIEQMARRLAAEIGLARLVRLFESTRVAVPVTIGWIKPVVLLPVSALSGLTSSQIEALLAHELAHIRRHDYLVNLLQSAVETLLFYHPAVWWVSARVRAEREDCCDDLAIRVCDRVVYVRALTDLASLSAPRLALAATDGSLIHRVRRILGEPGRDGAAGSGWLSVMLALAIVGGAAPVVVATVFSPDAQDPPKPKTTVIQVAGGVSAGVPGGVVGGVSGGVTSGVVGGVSGGVPGGVPGSVADEAQSQSDVQAAARALRELQALEATMARSLRDAQTQYEQERLSIEIQRLMTEHQSEREFLAAQMEETKRQIETLRKMVSSGTGMPQDLDKLMEQLRLLEIKRGAIDQKMNLAVRDVELKKLQAQQVEKILRRQDEIADERRSKAAQVEQILGTSDREYQRLTNEYVTLLRKKEEQRLTGSDARALEAQLERMRAVLADRDREMVELRTALLSALASGSDRQSADQRELQRVTEERARAVSRETADQARVLRELSERLTINLATLAEGDTVRAGDIVRVELHNEPDLPVNFVVQSDGTIRLPLVGMVKLIGLTPRQAQDAVRKQFSDRRLESGANAVVSVRRRASRDGAR